MVTRLEETEGVMMKGQKEQFCVISQQRYILFVMIPFHVNCRTSRNGQFDIYSIKMNEFKSQQNPTGLRTTAKTPRLVSSLLFFLL